jgi:hypothetical protein
MGNEEYLTVSSFKILWKSEILPSLKVEFADLIHKEVSLQLDLLSKKFDKVEQAQRFLSVKYDKIIEYIQSTKSHMQNMEKKTNDQQFNINENATQIGKTEDTIYEHEATMDEIQQYIRRDCLEILGIPVLPDEKPNELITELAEELGVDLSTDEISTAHRLPDTKNAKNRIIVKFIQRDKREEMYKSRSKLAGKTTRCLSSIANHSNVNSYSKIHINESLTASRKRLFGKVHAFKRENNYKFLWTTNGRILLRQSESSKISTFTNIDQWQDFLYQLSVHEP